MIVKGILRIVATAVISCALAWTLAELAPGSAAERAATASGQMPPIDAPASARASAIDRAAKLHRLDGSAPVRVVRSVGRMFVLDFGRSWRDRRPVRAMIADALPLTARIAALALLLALITGAAAGAAMARARSRTAGIAGGIALAVAAALPPAWLAFLFVGSGPRELAAALVLSVAPAAEVAVQVRNTLSGFLTGALAAAIRAKGASERRVTRHGLAVSLPALAPLLTTVGAYTLGASVIVERAFSLRGLGAVTLDAAARGDAPVLAAIATLTGTLLATLSVIADLLAREPA